MYLLLELLVFFAGFFLGSRQKPAAQQKQSCQQATGSEKKLRNADQELREKAKVPSKLSTPEPAGAATAAVQVPHNTQARLVGTKSMNNEASLAENRTLGFSTPATWDDVAKNSTTKASAPQEGIEKTARIALPRTDHAVVSRHNHQDRAIIGTSAQTKVSVSVANNSRQVSISISSDLEIEHEVHITTQAAPLESTVASNSSSQLSSGAVSVKSPTVHSSRAPNEDCGGAESTVEGDVQQSTPTAEPLLEGQAEALKRETAAHQQTRAELDRLTLWCDHLTDENEKFQTDIANKEREQARLRQDLQSVDDANMRLQVDLDQAKESTKHLTNSYLSSMSRMQAESTHLKAKNAWYEQVGIYFHHRMREVGKFLYQPEKLTAEYQKLMKEAARYTSRPTRAAAQPSQSGEENLVEIKGEDAPESSDGTVSDEDDFQVDEEDEEKISDEPYIDLEDYESDEHSTSSDEEEAPRVERPIRPLRARRAPLSTSTAIADDYSTKLSSSSLSKRTAEAQLAPSPGSSTLSTDPSSGQPSIPAQADESGSSEEQEQAQEPAYEPAYEPAQKRVHSFDFSNSSTRDRLERGDVQDGQKRPIHGTNGVKRPLRRNQRTPVGKTLRGRTSGGVNVSPSVTAFSVDFGFAGPSTRDGSVPEEIAPSDKSVRGTNADSDASPSATPFNFKFGSSTLSTGAGNEPEKTAVPIIGAQTSEKSTNNEFDFKDKSDTKRAPVAYMYAPAFLVPKSHTGEASVESSETNHDGGRDAVKPSSTESEVGPIGQQPLSAAACDTEQQPQGWRESKEGTAAAASKVEKADVVDADTEPTPAYAIKDEELMQSLMSGLASLSIEDNAQMQSLTNGIAGLSIGPPMLPMSPARWRSQGRLSGDWNISGMWNHSAAEVDRRPNLGGFADYTAAQWGNRHETATLDCGSETPQPAHLVSGSATAGQEISVLQGEGKESEGTRQTAGTGEGRAQEPRGDGSAVVWGVTKMEDGDSPEADPVAQPERDAPSPNLASSSAAQTDEVYQSPFCLKGAFGFEKKTPKEKYISPFSMRKRKT